MFDIDPKSEPILGTWELLGQETRYPGVLHMEHGQLRLKVHVGHGDIDMLAHPWVKALDESRGVSCKGVTRAGIVTLRHCACGSIWSGGSSSTSEQNPVELTIKPVEVWIGGDALDNNPYDEIAFGVPGLNRMLGWTIVDEDRTARRTAQEVKPHGKPEGLMRAYQTFAVTRMHLATVHVRRDGKPFEIEFDTKFRDRILRPDGRSIGPMDCVFVRSDAVTLDEIHHVATELEHFFALMRMGRFLIRGVRLVRKSSRSILYRVWKLGINDQQEEPFEHIREGIILPFARTPETINNALVQWFCASEHRRLARWLVCDTLVERTYTITKFLTLCQAWELVAREFTGSDTKVRDLPRLSDDLTACLEAVPAWSVKMICYDIGQFSKDVVRARNALTHWNPRDWTVDEATAMAFELTDKLAALFLVMEAHEMGLPDSDIGLMLELTGMTWRAYDRRPPSL